jgi:hypothetical protein
MGTEQQMRNTIVEQQSRVCWQQAHACKTMPADTMLVLALIREQFCELASSTYEAFLSSSCHKWHLAAAEASTRKTPCQPTTSVTHTHHVSLAAVHRSHHKTHHTG